MPITDWPANERPREKLLGQGPASLSDAELLAIFLRTGVNGKTAVDLARDLLVSFDGLRPLLEADRAALCAVHGFGAAKYVQLQAALELGRRYLESALKRDAVLNSPDRTRAFLKSRLRHHGREIFACLFLDNRHRVIGFEELFGGTIDGASVTTIGFSSGTTTIEKMRHSLAPSILAASSRSSGMDSAYWRTRKMPKMLAIAGTMTPP